MSDFLEPGRASKPIITESTIKTMLLEEYGLRVNAFKELASYDDWNFKIDADTDNIAQKCSHGYVLKILNSLDSKNVKVIDAQHEMMSLVSEAGIPTPRAVQSLTGREYLIKSLPTVDETGETNFIVRLFTFIPGMTLSSVTLTTGLCFKVGALAGRLDRALRGYSHSGFHGYQRKWHMDSIPRLSDILHVVKDDSDRTMLSHVIEEFKVQVLDNTNTLTRGVIHFDFNEDNILVAKTEPDSWSDIFRICGVLDYGDSTTAPYICEVAVAMAYMGILNDRIPILTASGHVLAGYLTQMTLSEEEISLLKICMCARLAQSLLIGAYSSQRNPEDDNCSCSTSTTALNGWPCLRELWNMKDALVLKEWRTIIEESTRIQNN